MKDPSRIYRWMLLVASLVTVVYLVGAAVQENPESWNSPIEPGVAYTPFKFQVNDKKPWRTLVGRQQFYIDHPWYIDLGETLPTFKEPIPEKYPLY